MRPVSVSKAQASLTTTTTLDQRKLCSCCRRQQYAWATCGTQRTLSRYQEWAQPYFFPARPACNELVSTVLSLSMPLLDTFVPGLAKQLPRVGRGRLDAKPCLQSCHCARVPSSPGRLRCGPSRAKNHRLPTASGAASGHRAQRRRVGGAESEGRAGGQRQCFFCNASHMTTAVHDVLSCCICRRHCCTSCGTYEAGLSEFHCQWCERVGLGVSIDSARSARNICATARNFRGYREQSLWDDYLQFALSLAEHLRYQVRGAPALPDLARVPPLLEALLLSHMGSQAAVRSLLANVDQELQDDLLATLRSEGELDSSYEIAAQILVAAEQARSGVPFPRDSERLQGLAVNGWILQVASPHGQNNCLLDALLLALAAQGLVRDVSHLQADARRILCRQCRQHLVHVFGAELDVRRGVYPFLNADLHAATAVQYLHLHSNEGTAARPNIEIRVYSRFDSTEVDPDEMGIYVPGTGPAHHILRLYNHTTESLQGYHFDALVQAPVGQPTGNPGSTASHTTKAPSSAHERDPRRTTTRGALRQSEPQPPLSRGGTAHARGSDQVALESLRNAGLQALDSSVSKATLIDAMVRLLAFHDLCPAGVGELLYETIQECGHARSPAGSASHENLTNYIRTVAQSVLSALHRLCASPRTAAAFVLQMYDVTCAQQRKPFSTITFGPKEALLQPVLHIYVHSAASPLPRCYTPLAPHGSRREPPSHMASPERNHLLTASGPMAASTADPTTQDCQLPAAQVDLDTVEGILQTFLRECIGSSASVPRGTAERILAVWEDLEAMDVLLHMLVWGDDEGPEVGSSSPRGERDYAREWIAYYVHHHRPERVGEARRAQGGRRAAPANPTVVSKVNATNITQVEGAGELVPILQRFLSCRGAGDITATGRDATEIAQMWHDTDALGIKLRTLLQSGLCFADCGMHAARRLAKQWRSFHAVATQGTGDKLGTCCDFPSATKAQQTREAHERNPDAPKTPRPMPTSRVKRLALTSAPLRRLRQKTAAADAAPQPSKATPVCHQCQAQPHTDSDDYYNLSVRLPVNTGAADWRMTKEAVVKNLAKHFRQYPTVPLRREFCASDTLGYCLPRTHCAVAGCEFEGHTEKDLEDHLLVHSALLMPLTQLLRAEAVPQKAALGLAYSLVVTCICQQRPPVANPSIDRRCLRQFREAIEDAELAELVCFICARRYPHVPRSPRANISWQKLSGPMETSTFFGCSPAEVEALFGLETYCRTYVHQSSTLAREELLRELDDWTCSVQCQGETVRVVCCPEDKRCIRKCPPQQTCPLCEAPICHSCLGALHEARCPPEALSNDLLVFYAPKEIYQHEVTFMELVCASPCITTMICFSLEKNTGKIECLINKRS